MSAVIIDGKAVARRVRENVAREVAEFRDRTGIQPGLATVLVGDDPASAVYVGGKRRACVEAGMADLHQHLPADTSQEKVAALLDDLAADPAVSGILLQLPVPEGLDGAALVGRIPPGKDVDGLTTASVGLLARGLPGLRPCTPSGIIELLDSYDVELSGTPTVVVGRSELVGRPVAALLVGRNATLTICHSRTRDLAAVCRGADVLVVAAGKQAIIGADAVKPGATVIDVGMHRTPQGLRGDVDFEAVREVAGKLTPVPGGVGPMTIAMLLRNTLLAAQAATGTDGPG
ncbi:bifunctional 5,10-methylene-tetrahydrofolate dehydrogenase/5,10-methylene-tetrahydrofolate cyclohydrolase [Frankia sp. CcI156]|uniref:Bifunctional protein FolD 2 n=1 Tax=Frankia casuarinae (strain DSM 45818 / CECT 9043 / HFP020203 / CcI3) TaxID=106370 RepID=FOLD2_FRACC|nr:MULTISPECIES: bifunctional methylenetetrahydrofolate dehydrogenase/methenyltetrahydrofolate cyclohydrolase FolD [Frankia]Q2J9L3.1 RecName: Full=Bifunctional protein FolD 2; Includes: RecName: Full=Methylenetetrahydrofolate dehydrogenase; Includes: RecName: Full=Methenyltetrahydrofolate cyclohydrolase [Frankia casuarinae]ABD12029.1 methenyltetrahydrofolate cyclohydrolase / 5,10-methylenetetrahydrofolate dehydrogenase (NADP+) [Frankia casuarinae]ETA01827.1 5,10-methylene-tetrahydrofolate dehydr